MNINKIIIEKYGDLRFDPIIFNEGFNLVYAKNGVGKTSLVKAIFLTLFGKSTPFFDYYGKKINESGRIEVDLELNLNNRIHTFSLEKISNTIPKKTKELFEHSEHLKYAASNYFITDNSMVRDISNSINFDQNGQQQLQQLISSASSGNDLIDKSLKTHLKRITDLIKFGASGKINKSLLVELNKDLNNKLGEIKNAKNQYKEAPDFDAGTIEELQNKIKLFDSQYEELNSKLTTLEVKEQWIKSFAEVSKNFDIKILNNFSLKKYKNVSFKKLVDDINSIETNEDNYLENLGKLAEDSSKLKEISKDKKEEHLVQVNIQSLEIQYDDIKKVEGEIVSLKKDVNAKVGLFEKMKKDLNLFSKPLFQFISKNQLTKSKKTKISDFNQNYFENNKDLKKTQLEISELQKTIKKQQENKNTIDIEAIIDDVNSRFEQNKDYLTKILSKDLTKTDLNKLKKEIIDNEKAALSNFKSVNKNLDAISEHKSTLNSLQKLEKKKEEIEGQIETLEADIKQFSKESKIPYKIITSEEVNSYIEAFDEIYKVHNESFLAKTKLPQTEEALATKIEDFKENIQDLGYKFDIKKDDNFSNIKVASKKHNKQVENQNSLEKEISGLNASIKIYSESIDGFETLRDNKLKEYGVETLNDLYKLNTLVEVIKILSSDSQFKNLDNSDREILLKGSIEDTITPQTLSDEITELGSEISDLETKRKDKIKELAESEIEANKEPEFLIEHLEIEELSLIEEIQDLKKEYLAIVLGIFLALKQLNSSDFNNIDFLQIINEILPNINSQFTSFNLDNETQQVSLGYNNTRKDFVRNPNEFSQGEIASIALSLRLAIQKASSKNGYIFPFIYDDCTEELDNEREKNFFSELFTLADKNQIIYLTHNYELVERLKKLSNNCNFIELENYRNL